MRYGKAARRKICIQGLNIAECRFPRRGITDMATRNCTRQRANNLVAIKVSCDMPHCTVRMEMMTIPRCNARGFLPTMLKRMQSKRNERRPRFGAIDAKNPAFLVQFVVVERVSCKQGQIRCRRRMPGIYEQRSVLSRFCNRNLCSWSIVAKLAGNSTRNGMQMA